MRSNPLVSIILPCYNGERFIQDSIDSVLAQDYEHWELLLINDGSTDNSRDIIKKNKDERIKYFEQSNRGVSAARNLGLSKMLGEYFCFLDADDQLTINSLSARLTVFEKKPSVGFVDGTVHLTDELGHIISHRHYQPNFRGKPLMQLQQLKGNCFFGPTWMIKRNAKLNYTFDEKMTHCEDLYFYISIASDYLYDYTDDAILNYRKYNNSAMSNLMGLENGYIALIKKLRIKYSNINPFYTKLKVTKIMFLSHLFDGKSILNAIGSVYRIMIS